MKNLFAFLLFFYALTVHATDYYVSYDGDDNNVGTSPEQAWKSLAKVQTESTRLRPGDRLLFRKGDTFYGQLMLRNLQGTEENQIVIGAYGSGPNPVLDGGVKVSGWSEDKDNIWVASITTFDVGMPMKGVYFDGSFISKARYPNLDEPNGGYLTEDTGHDFNDKSVIQDNDLPKLFADNYWQGAEVVSRTREYLLDIATVRRHTGNTIHLANKLTYGIPKGYGYFFQNSYKALDKDKEWYYDTSSRKLYLYLDNKNPSDHNIEVAYHDTVLGLANASHVKIENLTIQKGRGTTMSFDNLHHCYFASNQVLFSAENAIHVAQTVHLTIEDNRIDHTQNNALSLMADHTIIQDNEISNTATVAGMGTTGNGQYIACFIAGKDNVFQYNKIINTGYNAIHFDDGPWTISNNLIDGFNVVKNDGGGIYCFQNHKTSKVTQNIILHGGGAEAGVPAPDYPKDRGLYADGGSSHIQYEGNTVAYCGEGLLINAGNTITVTNNTFAGNRSVSVRAHWFSKKKGVADSRNIIVQDNIMVAANDYYPIYTIESQKNDVALFGNFDHNILSQPLSSSSPSNHYIFYTKEDIGYPGKGNLEYQYLHHQDLKRWKYGAHDNLAAISFDRFVVKNTGTNVIANASMEAPIPDKNSWVRTNTSSASFSINRIANGGIDGGTLRAKFSNQDHDDKGSVVQKGIAVKKDTYYQLAFDIKGTVNSTVVFKFVTGCCGQVHTVRPFQVTTTTTHYQYIFKADETTDEGRVFINLKAANDEVYIDNFTIKKATVEEVAFDDIVKLAYNASRQTKKITLHEKYVSVEGAPVPQTISLEPYESVVLLKAPPKPGVGN